MDMQNRIDAGFARTVGAINAVDAKVNAFNSSPTNGQTQLTYAGGNLVSITELDGTVTSLNYTGGVLTSIVKVKGTVTVTKTLTYAGDAAVRKLDKITTAVTT